MRKFLRGHAVYFFVSLLFFTLTSFAEDYLAFDIVDVGASSCSIVTLPHNNGIVVFDAGYWYGKHCYPAVKQALYNSNTHIKLMVVSHSDADHLGDAASILRGFEVLNLVRTGFASSSKSWKKFDDVAIRILYGRIKWGGAPLSSSVARNAISIVPKLQYAGRSILIPGDTVGRDLGGASDQCAYAEAEIVLNAEKSSLASDIILAPHHGSNSSSSSCFINTVSPQYVIPQAEYKHGHPAISAKDRYLA
jgi:competence protein ComEC